MKTTAIILSAAILAGCANTGAQYQPLVDSRTQGANYSKDLAECQAYATQRAGAADGAVAGAVFGALLGVALLAVGGGRGGWGNEVAAVGALYDELGLDGGLYLGVPFRTHTWNAWIADEEGFDPSDSMLAVSEPSTLADVDAERLDRVKHLMVVHHDDPVNKFGYRQVVRPPWWMGRPDTRPPKVPREVLWRPISTFVLTLVDLKNGMHFAPGTFVRRGHDYRIDTVAATAAAFRLQPTEDQRQAVEVALRKREVEWARRRLIARKFAAAREAINTNLKKWGVSVTTLDSLPEGDPEQWLESSPALTEPIDFVVADHDPAPAPA